MANADLNTSRYSDSKDYVAFCAARFASVPVVVGSACLARAATTRAGADFPKELPGQAPTPPWRRRISRKPHAPPSVFRDHEAQHRYLPDRAHPLHRHCGGRLRHISLPVTVRYTRRQHDKQRRINSLIRWPSSRMSELPQHGGLDQRVRFAIIII